MSAAVCKDDLLATPVPLIEAEAEERDAREADDKVALPRRLTEQRRALVAELDRVHPVAEEALARLDAILVGSRDLDGMRVVGERDVAAGVVTWWTN